jgi:hypothetical protein
MPQSNIKKNYFLIVSEYFSYKIGPIDLVRGSISSLDIGIFILPTFGPLCMFCKFRAPPNGTKKILKCPQVGRMYGTKYKLQNGPLTKSLGLFL